MQVMVENRSFYECYPVVYLQQNTKMFVLLIII